jgi:hypothetical protein
MTFPNFALADYRVVSSSATLRTNNLYIFNNLTQYDERPSILKNYLRSHKSPLAEYSENIINTADKYNINWKLVVAIAGVESTFGKRIPINSYNAYGWANGNFYFKSWEESIETVTKTLRLKYIDRGYDTVEKIAPIYAPPSSSWAWKVNYFINQINDPLVNFDL